MVLHRRAGDGVDLRMAFERLLRDLAERRHRGRGRGGPEDAEVAVEQARLDLHGGRLGELLALASGADLLGLAVALMIDEQPPRAVALANLDAHRALRPFRAVPRFLSSCFATGVNSPPPRPWTAGVR